ncbi:MAG: NADH-quinone oxidoreductase subunit J [Acidobacteria bacterium]|nr:MAG: NADH-quinone oxidoreductase subunit J [Acidobacteriota bacterium]
MSLVAGVVLGAISIQWVAFLVLAVVAIAAALVVVLHRSPVVGAMGLVTNFLCIAGIYVLLNAYFFAALQVIIYAGAVVVLITFVIMLLNLQPEAKGGPGVVPVALAALLGLALIAVVGRPLLEYAAPEAGPPAPDFGTVAQVGEALFTVYFYPFLAVSLALLSAMVGAVLLAKRRLED